MLSMTPTQLRAGRTTLDPRLDLVPPHDDHHKVKYPMLAPAQQWDHPAPVPVVLGTNWYDAFYEDALVERMVKGNKQYWIREGNLGKVQGGHCTCLEPDNPDRRDTYAWYRYYDQGQEGACVGFGWSRCMSLLNRRRYGARSFYFETQREDPWPGGAYPGADPSYEGTSVRSASDVLRTKGHLPVVRAKEKDWSLPDGIAAVRWAENVEDVLTALGRQGDDSVVLLNSWGTYYPRRVHVPLSVLDQIVFGEDGDCAVPTDR